MKTWRIKHTRFKTQANTKSEARPKFARMLQLHKLPPNVQVVLSSGQPNDDFVYGAGRRRYSELLGWYRVIPWDAPSAQTWSGIRGPMPDLSKMAQDWQEVNFGPPNWGKPTAGIQQMQGEVSGYMRRGASPAPIFIPRNTPMVRNEDGRWRPAEEGERASFVTMHDFWVYENGVIVDASPMLYNPLNVSEDDILNRMLEEHKKAQKDELDMLKSFCIPKEYLE